MRDVRDTFLHFLYDNLPTIKVQPIRRDPNNTTLGLLQSNAINVGFGRIEPGVALTTQLVLIDILADSELDASDMVQSLWLLLSTRFYTPLMDYSTDPLVPVEKGTMIMWKQNFKIVTVQNDRYFHYSILLPVQYHNDLP